MKLLIFFYNESPLIFMSETIPSLSMSEFVRKYNSLSSQYDACENTFTFVCEHQDKQSFSLQSELPIGVTRWLIELWYLNYNFLHSPLRQAYVDFLACLQELCTEMDSPESIEAGRYNSGDISAIKNACSMMSTMFRKETFLPLSQGLYEQLDAFFYDDYSCTDVDIVDINFNDLICAIFSGILFRVTNEKYTLRGPLPKDYYTMMIED